ncbi:hypothetical protein AAAT94_02945 [Intestinimonas aquisgranensis]|nr:hypothetical protein [Intestinimonas aquisgranensis]
MSEDMFARHLLLIMAAAMVIQLWESSLEKNKITSDIQEIETSLEIKEGYTTMDEPTVKLTFG